MELPGFDGKVKNIVENHNTNDIIKLLLSKDQLFIDQVQDFCEPLKQLPANKACREIYDSLRDNIEFVPDPFKAQKLKSPSALFHYKEGDCKSFSLYIANCLRTLNIPYCYRFVSCPNPEIPGDLTPTHVYIIAFPDTDDQIIIDATLPRFNYEKFYTSKNDITMLQFLSGNPENSYVVNTARSLYSKKRRNNHLGATAVFYGPRKAETGVEAGANKLIDDQKQLPVLQAQKTAIANDTTLTYTDRKTKIDAIQAQQNEMIKELINMAVFSAQAMAVPSWWSSAASSIFNVILPGSGKALSLLTSAIQKNASKDVQNTVSTLTQFMGDSFPFYQGKYPAYVAPATTAKTASNLLKQTQDLNTDLKNAEANGSATSTTDNGAVIKSMQKVIAPGPPINTNNQNSNTGTGGNTNTNTQPPSNSSSNTIWYLLGGGALLYAITR